MEIKTCEQYAIAKLFEQEDTIENLKDEIDELHNTIVFLRQDIETVKAHCQVYKNAFGERWIRLEVWEKYDKTAFPKISKILALEETNTETEGEENGTKQED